MTKHDTPAIRRLASQLSGIANKLSTAERDASRRISGISDDMLGDTTKAIDQVTGKLSSELQSICSGLNRYARELNNYAHELDMADAKIQSQISTR